MKFYVRFFNVIPVALFMLILIASYACGQDGDIGGFDIDRVYQDAVSGDDTGFADGGDITYGLREPENYAIVIFRIIGYLVVMVAVIFGIAWIIRKVGVAGVPKVSGGNNMDAIETLYIGQDRGIALIRVSDAVYLIGHTPGNIVMLEKIEGDKAIELIASSKGGATIMNFKDAFNNFMGKMKKT